MRHSESLLNRVIIAARFSTISDSDLCTAGTAAPHVELTIEPGPPRSRQITGKAAANASRTTIPPESCKLGKTSAALLRYSLFISLNATRETQSTLSATFAL